MVVIKRNTEREARASWRYWERPTGWWSHPRSEIFQLSFMQEASMETGYMLHRAHFRF